MLEGLFQPMHLLVIFFIALLVFGPKKLPEQYLVVRLSDFGTFDFERVRAWPRTVERGVGGAFQIAGLLGRNSFPSPSRG